jgi:hypothetical protein
MRRRFWTFTLLLTAVLCASAVPRVDRPETSYNEVDTPVNQAAPSAIGMRFVRPAQPPISVPDRSSQVNWDLRGPAEAPILSTPSIRVRPHSLLQQLLCTLLI